MNWVPVALAHDYLTQRGGAERVVLAMAGAFAQAPVYTTLYEPAATFAEFADLDVRVSWLNRIGPLRRRHRLSLPLLAAAAGSTHIDADVTLVSSSGWAHGMPVTGRKIVYCHAPARWLYQRDRYLGLGDAPTARGASAGAGGISAGAGGTGSAVARGTSAAARGWTAPAAVALGVLSRPLRRWDRRAAASADLYLANSTVTRDAIKAVYGIDAEILPPPPALDVAGATDPVADLDDGFLLCVSRLLPYKNVDVLIRAVLDSPQRRLVIVGKGPDERRLAGLAAQAGDRIRLLGGVSDASLRWLYAHCQALVAASYEDFGLSPLEAAAFGRPAVVLRAGGYLDTVVEGETGLFFDAVEPVAVRAALDELERTAFSEQTLKRHAEAFGLARFQQRLHEVVGS